MKKATWTKHDGSWMIHCPGGREGEMVAATKKGAGASVKRLGREVEADVFEVG